MKLFELVFLLKIRQQKKKTNKNFNMQNCIQQVVIFLMNKKAICCT